jgi:large subunit ribosomal protein L5
MDTLQQRYQKTLSKELQTELKIQNIMAIPHLEKIVINIGIKDAVADKKNVDRAVNALEIITGQHPKISKAKKSIASFKLRQGDAIGTSVTLRGQRMYSFFEKLVNVVLPRLKDFRGVSSNSFDMAGNYTIGFSEYSVFPEIDPSTIERMQGLEIVIVNSAKDKTEGRALLTKLGMPFEKGGKS